MSAMPGQDVAVRADDEGFHYAELADALRQGDDLRVRRGNRSVEQLVFRGGPDAADGPLDDLAGPNSTMIQFAVMRWSAALSRAHCAPPRNRYSLARCVALLPVA